MKTLFHKVVSVEALPDFVLGVRFSGGEEKRYDMKPVFAAWPMFEGLRESPELFGEVAVGPGGYGVVWGDEWDVGADELFANGVAHTEARRDGDAEGGSSKGQKGGQGVAGGAATRRTRMARANEQTILRCNNPTEP